MGDITLDKETLSLLLLDQTTGGNIIWATDDYSALGEGYRAEKPITIDEVAMLLHRMTVSKNIYLQKKNKVKKSKEEQIEKA